MQMGIALKKLRESLSGFFGVIKFFLLIRRMVHRSKIPARQLMGLYKSKLPMGNEVRSTGILKFFFTLCSLKTIPIPLSQIFYG
jgi:hypothetical protein